MEVWEMLFMYNMSGSTVLLTILCTLDLPEINFVHEAEYLDALLHLSKSASLREAAQEAMEGTTLPPPPLIPEEPEYLVEWEDYEEDPTINCNLTSFELNSSATYLCQDGTTWAVFVEVVGGDKCIYSRRVTNIEGKTEVRKRIVNCDLAQDWMQDLVQYETLSGVPDMFLFDSKLQHSEGGALLKKPIGLQQQT